MPPRTSTVSPGAEALQARLSVAKGLPIVPELLSLPLTATYRVVAEARPGSRKRGATAVVSTWIGRIDRSLVIDGGRRAPMAPGSSSTPDGRRDQQASLGGSRQCGP